MANRYTTISSRQTVQVISQTESADVEAVTIQTVPSGIRTTVPVPLAPWQQGHADGYLAPVAELLEGLISGGLVTRAVYVQTTDASGLLAGFMQMTVSYTPTTGLAQPFTTAVLVPMTALASLDAFGVYSTSGGGSDPITTAYNQLKATAAL